MLKLLSTTLLAGLALAGCATQDYVDEQLAAELAPVNMRLFNVEQRATVQEGGFDALVRRADGVDQVLRSHGDRIQEALDRALAAGKLAEGKLVYEVVLTDDQLRFGDGRANLSDAAKAILDDFAKRLRDENKNVYVEIQGHTDSRGEEPYNLKLGQARADAVLRYLHLSGGLPLHRLASVSYGESKPVADNMYAPGRAQNRRVILVVLK
jgi:outer membrane protein OmpA-like peptidoglycan-associated protein